jgi:hypothetical protein
MTFYINGTGMGHLYNDSVADLQFPHPRKLVKPCNKVARIITSHYSKIWVVSDQI